MPIDTRLDGDPSRMYATARRLRDEPGFEVNASLREGGRATG